VAHLQQGGARLAALRGGCTAATAAQAAIRNGGHEEQGTEQDAGQ